MVDLAPPWGKIDHATSPLRVLSSVTALRAGDMSGLRWAFVLQSSMPGGSISIRRVGAGRTIAIVSVSRWWLWL